MDSRFAAIHPELQQAARKAPSITISGKNLWLLRLLMSFARAPKPPSDVDIENRHIPGADGQGKIRLRLYRPKSASGPLPVLFWLHGGGYVIGTPEMDDGWCAAYAREAGIAIVSVDYPLGPRHPFPEGLEIAYAALLWVQAHAGEIDVDAGRIAIGGVSAGAGIIAALAQLALDRGEVSPVFQLLVYPMLDDRTAYRTDDGPDHVTWNRASNRFGWKSYLGKIEGAAEVPPYAAAGRRANLSGLPPAWIGVGSADLFHDEDVAYAERLKACGVECELLVAPGGFHGFDLFAPDVPVVKAFREAQIAALRKHLFPSGT